jgi:uncharacterized protein YycO
MKRLLSLVVLVTAVTACSNKAVLVQRPTDATADAAVTQLWTHEIAGVARDGDWLLTRSYAAVGDVIAVGTPGEDLSHASIYDASKGTVIEAIGSGVREIPLEQLVARNHYVIVVRPSHMTAAEQTHAVERARTKVGAPFDYAGMFGFNADEKWFCSELVAWASQTEARNNVHETVMTPPDLMKYGEVIYWSGKRDDAQVMAVAKERVSVR